MVKPKSVVFYKRLILSVTALLILLPTASTVFLLVENRRLVEKAEATPLPDDVLTVGATQQEPPNLVKSDPILSYQLLDSDFKSEFIGFSEADPQAKEVYLTFDDGPSMGTSALLDLLKAKGVKATFFVNGKTNRWLNDQLRRAAEEGHQIGMHSYSHRYKTIYASMENLIEDFYRNYLYIKMETGQAPSILRFPGGSINIFNAATYQTMIAEMLRRGFVYYDWNVSGGDAVANAQSQEVATNVINGVHLCWGPAFVLLHDNGNQALVGALDTIIDTLTREGYSFKRLDNSIKPPAFVYPD